MKKKCSNYLLLCFLFLPFFLVTLILAFGNDFFKNSYENKNTIIKDILRKDCKENDFCELKIAFITNSGSIEDKSFNQSGWKGIENFVKKVQDQQDNLKYLIKKKFFSPQLKNKVSLIAVYNLAVFWGAKILVLNGFFHAITLQEIKHLFGKKVIVIVIDTSYRDENYENFVALEWKNEIPSFLSGMTAILYYFDNNCPRESIKYSTFGGLPIGPVIDYMFGFLYSFKLYKENNEFQQLLNGIFEKKKKKKNNCTFEFINLGNFFTGSFEAGTKEVVSMVSAIRERGIHLVFPVAGPQTGDVLNLNDIHVIGVDQDMTQIYPKQKKKFITNAVKTIAQDLESLLLKIVTNPKKSFKEFFSKEMMTRKIGSIQGSGIKDFSWAISEINNLKDTKKLDLFFAELDLELKNFYKNNNPNLLVNFAKYFS